jgi:aminopeptidase N
LSNLPAELVVDFKGTTKNVLVNGEQQEVKTNEGFIYIDVGKLKIGENSLAIEYQNEYNNDGSGCVSFVDVDTKQYIYTQFEPYYANRVFPCFDQPDLKAGMRLNVISPKAWKKVLSNEYSTI